MTKGSTKRVINARLDSGSSEALNALLHSLGWSESQIIREALIKFAAQCPRKKKPGFVGLGKFSSGIRDLASNKRHLEGFGS